MKLKAKDGQPTVPTPVQGMLSMVRGMLMLCMLCVLLYLCVLCMLHVRCNLWELRMERANLLEVATHISATATVSRALKAQGVVDAGTAGNAM